jgi:hypothetical protein
LDVSPSSSSTSIVPAPPFAAFLSESLTFPSVDPLPRAEVALASFRFRSHLVKIDDPSAANLQQQHHRKKTQTTIFLMKFILVLIQKMQSPVQNYT